MTLFFLILVILFNVVLGLIVLIQNPKGGGLAGNIGGFSTQFMGVKQTTDVLEKGTWLFAGLIAVLTIVSPIFISKSGADAGGDKIQKINSSAPAQPNPANTTTFPATTTPAAGDTNKK